MLPPNLRAQMGPPANRVQPTANPTENLVAIVMQIGQLLAQLAEGAQQDAPDAIPFIQKMSEAGNGVLQAIKSGKPMASMMGADSPVGAPPITEPSAGAPGGGFPA